MTIINKVFAGKDNAKRRDCSTARQNVPSLRKSADKTGVDKKADRGDVNEEVKNSFDDNGEDEEEEEHYEDVREEDAEEGARDAEKVAKKTQRHGWIWRTNRQEKKKTHGESTSM